MIVCTLLARRAGEDHRSLQEVLQDLQERLKGQEPSLVPGESISRPLHVVLQVGKDI